MILSIKAEMKLEVNKGSIAFNLFLEEVSSLLSDYDYKVEASEYGIKESICKLMHSSKDRGKVREIKF